jgi:hypothetical protein
MIRGLLIIFLIGVLFSAGWYFGKKDKGLAKLICSLWIILFLGATGQFNFTIWNVLMYWFGLIIIIVVIDAYAETSANENSKTKSKTKNIEGRGLK